jgi:hypothetical protein
MANKIAIYALNEEVVKAFTEYSDSNLERYALERSRQGLCSRICLDYLTEDQQKQVVLKKRSIKKTGSEYWLYDVNAVRQIIQDEMLILWVRDFINKESGAITLDDIRRTHSVDDLFIEQSIEHLIPNGIIYSASQIIGIGNRIKEQATSQTGIHDEKRKIAFCDSVDRYIKNHFCDISKNYNKHEQFMKISELPPIWKELAKESIESDTQRPEDLINVGKQLEFSQKDDDVVRLKFREEDQNAIAVPMPDIKTARAMQDNVPYLKERYGLNIATIEIRKKDLEAIRIKDWPEIPGLYVVDDLKLLCYLGKTSPVIYKDESGTAMGSSDDHDNGIVWHKLMARNPVTVGFLEEEIRREIRRIGAMQSYRVPGLQKIAKRNRVLLNLRETIKDDAYTIGASPLINKSIGEIILSALDSPVSVTGIIFNPVKLHAAIRARMRKIVSKYVDSEVTRDEQLEIRFGPVKDEDWEY